MKFMPTRLPEVVVIEPDVYRDDRGFFLETFHGAKYREGGVPADFVQQNQSRSARHVLRGLHAQLSRPQGKLVRVLHGAVFDVAVDIRVASPTFGQWAGVELSADNFRQVYVPPGFLHGFCALSEYADVAYQCTDFYDPTDELGVRWDDPQIGIDWPVREPKLSAKDAASPLLAEAMHRLTGLREAA